MLGNRVTEKDLRNWLDQEGWSGQFAKIEELELHAIERPGWVQVFRFRLQVRKMSTGDANEQPWQVRWGVILDDERRRSAADRTQIWMYDDCDTCRSHLETLSTDRLTLRKGQTGTGMVALLGILAAMAVFALVGHLLGIF